MQVEGWSGEALLGELLACPVCHVNLDLGSGEAIHCRGCGRTYPASGGVPDFTPHPPPDPDVRDRWPLWEQLERNGHVAYENDPLSSLSIDDRDDCAAFALFAELGGLVLDVGCGPQRLPSYAREFPGVLVGIDPLLGEVPRGFVFVRGVGEYLPFRSDSYDRVLFGTSLDHTLVPTRALAEARRVVKPSGSVVVWFGEKQEVPDTAVGESHEWYERLSVPDGAADRFHAQRFNRELARSYLAAAELEIDRVQQDGHGNVFMSTSKR